MFVLAGIFYFFQTLEDQKRFIGEIGAKPAKHLYSCSSIECLDCQFSTELLCMATIVFFTAVCIVIGRNRSYCETYHAFRNKIFLFKF